MIRGEEMQPIGQDIMGAMRETVSRFAGDDACFQKECEITVKGDFSEADHDTDFGQCLNLTGKMTCAVANLQRKRLVAGRGAANDGGNPRVAKLETIFTGEACRLAGKAQLVQDGIHESTGAVACKWPPCTVCSMSTWSQTQDEDAGAGIAKARDRPSPVGLVLVGAASGFADPAAVVPQTGAASAIDNGFADLLQKWRKRLNFGAGHCIP